MTGAGLGMAIGSLFGPVGLAVGGAVGGATGMAAEITNSTNVLGNMQGDGGHNEDQLSYDLRQKGVRRMWVRKSDLCRTGWNTAASVGRAILAPLSTLGQKKKHSGLSIGG